MYLKLNYKDTEYAKYLYKILKIKGKEIDTQKLPAIFRFYYENLKKYSQKNDPNRLYKKYLNKPTSNFNSRIDLKDQFKQQPFSLNEVVDYQDLLLKFLIQGQI